MLFLFLSIGLNALIFTLFKLFGLRKINTFHAIVVNYFVCVITGSLFAGINNVLEVTDQDSWVYAAIGLGVVFIATFYFMALTAQRISMAAASIASKMSLAIPVLFSLFVLKINSDFSWINYVGIALALPATWMSARSSEPKHRVKPIWLLLPALVFLGNGIIDTTINYTNYHLLEAEAIPLFPVFIFLSAAVIGGMIVLFGKTRITFRSIVAGAILGIINYFSVFSILRALDALNNNGALVFPIFNTGIVVLSAAIGLFLFNENLNKINKAGILVAILSIMLVMYPSGE
jgi:drug/metabolite transporter (DMT)-like permease